MTMVAQRISSFVVEAGGTVVSMCSHHEEVQISSDLKKRKPIDGDCDGLDAHNAWEMNGEQWHWL